MTTDDDSRRQGVEFGSLAEALEDATFPMDGAELLESYGDHELELEDGTETLRAVLEPQGEVTVESAEDGKQNVVGMVGDGAIGRKRYSDRGGETKAQEEAEDEIEVVYDNDPIEIGFNVNYLVDALSVMEAEEFTLELTSPDSSGLLREKGDDSSQYVVMPMRL
jgi:hypothetical protein